MGRNQIGNFIDLDPDPGLEPDPHSLNFENTDPHTTNADPHH